MKTLIRAATTLYAAFALTVTAVQAQPAFPNKPVRFVVPFAPGGQSDVVARMVAEKLAVRWGQPVVVDNKAGAATTIGADIVAKAPADGYTMLLAPAPFVITQYAYPKLPYDSRRDFTPVTLLVTNPLVVVTNPAKVPGRTLAEFVDHAKKTPGALAYGTPGNGSLPHLAQVSFMFASPLEVMQHVTSGKLQALAMTSDRRVPYWPQVPTLKESGYPEYEAYAWFGVVVAAATPKDIVAKINADIVAVLRQPDMVERLKNLGADVAADTPEEFGRFLNAEHARWSAAVKAAKVTVQ